MSDPRSYVVRIYCQGYRTLSGVVEDPHTGRMRTFRNIQQLSVLLRGPIIERRPSRHKSAVNPTI